MHLAPGVEPGQQALHQGLKVGALAQGGQVHGQAVDAVIQVTAKAPLLCRLAQVAVGGAHQGKVHLHRPATPQGRDRSFLQDAQQAGLHGQRHVANFIQKERAAIGLTQATQAALFLGAGEGAGGIAKEFSLNQVFRNGGAVDRHKRAAGVLAAVVTGPRKVFFAHAGFALHQDGNGFVEHAPGLVCSMAPFEVARVQTGKCVLGGAGAGLQRAGNLQGQDARICLHLHKQGGAVVQVDLGGQARAAFVAVQQIRQTRVQHTAQLGGANALGVHVQQHQGKPVGANDPAIFRHRQYALGHRANAFRMGMQMHPNAALAGGDEQPVLDHAGRRINQPQRQGVAVVLVARNIQNANHMAA